jgi:hypothetical protein
MPAPVRSIKAFSDDRLDQIYQILVQLESQEQQIPSNQQRQQNILSSQVRYNLRRCIVEALQQGFSWWHHSTRAMTSASRIRHY